MAGWREEPQPGGGSILVSRPDLWAAGGTVLGSAGCLIVSARYALDLLGRGARTQELRYQSRRADDMIHGLGLPEAWTHWRR
jgi:hypothetical protein